MHRGRQSTTGALWMALSSMVLEEMRALGFWGVSPVVGGLHTGARIRVAICKHISDEGRFLPGHVVQLVGRSVAASGVRASLANASTLCSPRSMCSTRRAWMASEPCARRCRADRRTQMRHARFASQRNQRVSLGDRGVREARTHTHLQQDRI